jgi:hypothetical protein
MEGWRGGEMERWRRRWSRTNPVFLSMSVLNRSSAYASGMLMTSFDVAHAGASPGESSGTLKFASPWIHHGYIMDASWVHHGCIAPTQHTRPLLHST